MTEPLRRLFPIKVLEQRPNGGRIRITTVDPDHAQDRIFPQGGRFQNYLRNPVVQWGHNYFDPWATIGRTNSLEVDAAGITADFDLRPAANEADPQSVVLLLWNGGWVNAASVGIWPDGWLGDMAGLQPNELGGRDIIAWDLLEWSLCPVPMNPQALREKNAGVGTDFAWALVFGASGATQLALAAAAVAASGPGVPVAGPLQRPYPGEHACRLRDPNDFEADTFVRTTREHEGKKYDVIQGRLKGEDALTEQAYRYPKDVWTEAAARAHCTDHDGSAFEPASGADEEAARWGTPPPPVGETPSLPLEREGRILSTKNRELIGDCVDKLRIAAKALQELLDATAPDERAIASANAANIAPRTIDQSALPPDVLDLLAERLTAIFKELKL